MLGSAELIVVGVLNLISADLGPVRLRHGALAAVPRGEPGRPGGALASSLPASAANVGSAFGSAAGGVAEAV